MKTFKELFNLDESRDLIKAAYLKNTYNKKDMESLLKKGDVLVIYRDSRARSKQASAHVKEVKDPGILVDDTFGGKDVLVKFEDIIQAQNIKN